jgi:LacI family transcriptional regulator
VSSSEHITITDVANRAGVSIATVSRYLNNPTSLRKKNLESVERAIKELNYQPLVYARKLAGGKLNSYGLIIPGYENIFYSYYAMETIRGVAASLEKHKVDLHLHVFWGKDTLNTSLVDGAIFADVLGNDEQLYRLVAEGLPVVVINKRFDDEYISYVAVDNEKGAFEATEYLINHGHKKIVHLAGNDHVQCAQERLAGYQKALEKNNITVPKEYIQYVDFSRKEAREKIKKVFSLKDKPTAFFCCSDDVACEVLAYCEEEHIRVPDDISVIGFDDNPHCMYGNLILTTVRQPLGQMAQKAVEILQKVVSDKEAIQKVVLEPELVVRDTVQFIS